MIGCVPAVAFTWNVLDLDGLILAFSFWECAHDTVGALSWVSRPTLASVVVLTVVQLATVSSWSALAVPVPPQSSRSG